MDSKASRAISILGMHRSGTSVLSGSLNLLGIDLGSTEKLVQGAKYNPKGFWEFKEITKTQEKLLHALGHSWHTTKPLPDNWYVKPEINSFRERLKEITITEFADKSLWGWKDPRTSLLVPMWEEILAELNIEPSYVIAVRNPLDVAASLERRNNFLIEKSLRIWGLYTLSALLATTERRRSIVIYDDLLLDWKLELKRVANQLDIPWPEDEVALENEMSGFITQKLQHSKSTLDDLKSHPSVPKWVVNLYELVEEAKKSPEFLASEQFTKAVRKIYTKQFVRKFFLKRTVK